MRDMFFGVRTAAVSASISSSSRAIVTASTAWWAYLCAWLVDKETFEIFIDGSCKNLNLLCKVDKKLLEDFFFVIFFVWKADVSFDKWFDLLLVFAEDMAFFGVFNSFELYFRVSVFSFLDFKKDVRFAKVNKDKLRINLDFQNLIADWEL